MNGRPQTDAVKDQPQEKRLSENTQKIGPFQSKGKP